MFSDKTVTFAKCYVAYNIPTGKSRLVSMPPLKPKIQKERFSDEKPSFGEEIRKRRYDANHTPKGFLINCLDHTDHKPRSTKHYPRPTVLQYLEIIRHISRDDEVIKDNDAILQYYWREEVRFSSFFDELLTMVNCVRKSENIIKTYQNIVGRTISSYND